MKAGGTGEAVQRSQLISMPAMISTLRQQQQQTTGQQLQAREAGKLPGADQQKDAGQEAEPLCG